MNTPKPLASLSSGLLARKGGAKPAMRRQNHSLSDTSEAQVEDLGWNDMGYDVDPNHHDDEKVKSNPLAGAIPEAVPAVKQQQDEIAAKLGQHPRRDDAVDVEKATPEEVAPKEKSAEPAEKVPVPLSISKEVAPVAEQSNIGVAPPRRHRSAEIPQQVDAPKQNGAAKKKPRKSAAKSRTRKAKAAFTLRLDAERHLKLRLATAVKNVSAQQLVTKAVDEYLKNIPELEELVERVPSRGTA